MKIRSPLLTRLSAVAFTGVIWLLFRMLKLDFREETPSTNPYTMSPPERYLYCVWHDSMVIPAFAGKHRSTAALTSRHADGAFVANVLRWVGVSSVRGSTSRMGASAMRQLMRATEDKHIVITPDGPRGPRRQMSTGIAFLASRTGRAIIPTAYSCVRCWRIAGTWTNLVIPKPFTRVYLLAGEPIRVPPGLGGDQLQQYVARIQAAMDRLNETAECLSEGRESNQRLPAATAQELPCRTND
ncbi:MAG: lysophospholipid acyltransferase family protein [Pirellulales bacterium]|nr:lysophospholipid acyltransferase family protein [Pirellulales bacterium]